ncbi:MAG: glycosyltransferase family 4 protein, partial [Acidobacteria bacterium]|nr:glycosyltransferase family 4 protein [Acidobacteriota bacterium]
MSPSSPDDPVAVGSVSGVEGAAIWLVTDVYPPGCGGSGWSTHALARTLVHRGHSVEVISIDPGATGVSQRVFDGIHVVEVGVQSARRNPLRRLGGRDYAHNHMERYLNERLRNDRDVRILHAQHLHSGAPTVAAAARHGRASVQTLRDYWPVCLHGTSWWHGTECSGCTTANLVGCMNEYWRWPVPLARLMVPWARRRLGSRRAGIEAAGRVITVSDWVRRRIEPEAPAARYEVVPNIVDADETRSAAAGADDLEHPPEGTYLVAAGKLVATKGFDQMLSALAAAGSSAPVILAGSGPESSRLRRQAGELGVDVVFPGWVAHPRLLRLIAGAKAFLLPSAWSEPLSPLLLEALALGTPVITGRSGGNP